MHTSEWNWIQNRSAVPYPVLIIASWPAYGFLNYLAKKKKKKKKKLE